MSRTANLRRQHDAAAMLVEQISADIENPQPNAAQIYRMGLTLAKLTGMLRIHFAIEDRTLYPHMMSSDHADAANTAADFQKEMGALGATYLDFAERWNSRTIGAAFPKFCAEARAVLAALTDRIERENTILYPLADAISDDQTRRTA